MNKFQKVINQITKDTLLQEPVRLLICKYGRERVFRAMRISHIEEIKNNKVDFDTFFHKRHDLKVQLKRYKLRCLSKFKTSTYL